ncbi:MAG: ABC transporter substrate-binding protein [Dehalococcoidia bacterium]
MATSRRSASGVIRGRLTRRRAIALGGAGAFLVACGGGGGDEEQGQGASQSTGATGVQPTTAAVQGEGTPKVGGTFTWSDVGDTPLDPTNNPTYRANTLAGFGSSRLLKFKTGATPEVFFNYEVIPDLAVSHEFQNDGLQLTFKLQPTAKFHNKPPVAGRAVEAEDVKASMERFQTAPKNTNKNAFGSPTNKIVESIETPDAKTVVVKLAKQYAPILNLFANHQNLWIQPKEIDTGYDPAKVQIGSGPWSVESIEPDKQITMKRNPDYYQQGKPYIDTGIRAVVPDTAQNIAQLQAGRLDIYGVPANNKDEVLQVNPTFQVLTYIPTTYTFIAPQLRNNSPFNDVRVRRAISMAIDRKSWVDLLYLGQGRHDLNAVPASMGKWWLDPQSGDAGAGAQNFKYDPKAARDLLKAAGMENMPLRYIFTNTAYGDTFNQGAEATAGMLKEGGFSPSILTQDYLREYIDARGTFFGNYEGVFYGLQTPFSDPHDYLFSMNHPASARNHIGLDDPRLTAMIDDEEKTIDEAARVKKAHDIQRYWIEQMYYIPVSVGYAYSFRQPWVKSLFYSGSYGWGAEALENAWIDRT